MKVVLAVIQPFKLDEVTRSLTALPRFPGVTVSRVRGFGREHVEIAAQAIGELEYFTDKVQIESVVDDDQVEWVIAAIARAAHTGLAGDGIIFVLPVERSIRIGSFVEGTSS